MKGLHLAVFLIILLSVSNAWYNASFQYRKEINLSYSGGTIIDVQVPLTITYSNNMSTINFSDILITYLNGSIEKEVPFWIEEVNNGSNALVWVRIPRLSNSETLYVYYGNLSPYNQINNNGVETFFFFEHFDSTLNSSWIADPGFSIQMSNSRLITNQQVGIAASIGFPLENGYVSETKASFDAYGASYSGVFATPMSSQFTAGSNANADATALYMTSAGTTTLLYHWAGNGCVAGYNIDIAPVGAILNVGQDYIFSTAIYPATGGYALSFYLNRAAIHQDTTPTYCKSSTYVRLGYFARGSPAANTQVSYDWVLVRKFYDPLSFSTTTGKEENVGGNIFVRIVKPLDNSFVGNPVNVLINTTGGSGNVFLYANNVLVNTWNNVSNTTLSINLNLPVGNNTLKAEAVLSSNPLIKSTDEINVVVLQSQQQPASTGGDTVIVNYNNTSIDVKYIYEITKRIEEVEKKMEEIENGKIEEMRGKERGGNFISYFTPSIPEGEDYSNLLWAIIILLLIVLGWLVRIELKLKAIKR